MPSTLLTLYQEKFVFKCRKLLPALFALGLLGLLLLAPGELHGQKEQVDPKPVKAPKAQGIKPYGLKEPLFINGLENPDDPPCFTVTDGKIVASIEIVEENEQQPDAVYFINYKTATPTIPDMPDIRGGARLGTRVGTTNSYECVDLQVNVVGAPGPNNTVVVWAYFKIVNGNSITYIHNRFHRTYCAKAKTAFTGLTSGGQTYRTGSIELAAPARVGNVAEPALIASTSKLYGAHAGFVRYVYVPGQKLPPVKYLIHNYTTLPATALQENGLRKDWHILPYAPEAQKGATTPDFGTLLLWAVHDVKGEPCYCSASFHYTLKK